MTAKHHRVVSAGEKGDTSVNPARSTGPALFVGGWALAQLWLFWVAPLAGAVIGGFAYKWLGGDVKVSVARAAE